MRNRRLAPAFTLLELLLVVVIIGILAAAVIPKLSSRAGQARQATAAGDIFGALGTALDMYEQDVGQYPTTAQGLQALIAAPSGTQGWNGPYIKNGMLPTDPWGNAYVYTFPSSKAPNMYEVESKGPDGKLGTDDDISSSAAPKKAAAAAGQ